MPEVLIAAAAGRDLDEIDEPDLSRLKTRILSLGDEARPHGSTKLKGKLYRARVGDWRILYAIDDKRQVVTILRVLRRSERTYRNI